MPVEPQATPREAARIFWSGHSLTDQPIPDFMAAVAQSLGPAIRWNRQYVVGSSIIVRTRGRGETSGWAGYSRGQNRDGEGLNVIEELRHPKTLDGGRYDTLIITEQHALLQSVYYNDPVRYLRHYHERFIEGNPRGTTWFYEPWFSLVDKNDPRRWIAYERAASPIWQCMGTRINVSLEAEGRPDRLQSLPAGLALAELVERATQGGGVPAITRETVRATVDGLIADEVHLTRTGAYYVALVTYAFVAGRSPVGAWAPDDVSPAQAASLQRVAAEVVADYRRTNVPLTLEQCRAQVQGPFARLYWSYTGDLARRSQRESVVEWLRRTRMAAIVHYRLWREGPDNFLRFDPATDRAYWLPPP